MINNKDQDYVSPWGWWFQGDTGKPCNWPDPRKQKKQASTTTATDQTGYTPPPWGTKPTIQDLQDAVRELEQRHPDKAKRGFDANEIASIMGRISPQSVDPILKDAAAHNALVMTVKRASSGSNCRTRYYNTPEYGTEAQPATDPHTKLAALAILQQSKSGSMIVEQIASRLGLANNSVRQFLIELRDEGLTASKVVGPGRTTAWSLTAKGQSIELPPMSEQVKQPIKPDLSADYVAKVVAIVSRIEASRQDEAIGVTTREIMDAAPTKIPNTIYQHLKNAVSQGLLHTGQIRMTDTGNRMTAVYSRHPIKSASDSVKSGQQMIEEVLQDGQAMRIVDIVNAVGLSAKSVRWAVQRMVLAGKIEQLPSGKEYRLCLPAAVVA